MSKVKVLVFEPYKKSYILEVEDHITNYQQIVDGLIEIVRIQLPNMVLVCNDCGLIDELPRDRGIHGTFFIVGVDEDYNFKSLTEEQIQTAQEAYENKKNYESKNQFLSTYFEEKKLEYRQFHYKTNNCLHIIDTETIISYILSYPDEGILKILENAIRRLDFYNKDIYHFLRYIGRNIAEENSLM